MRVFAFIASLAIVVWATLAVPMPLRQTVPGAARPIEDLVTIGGSHPVNGDLSMLTVRGRDAVPLDVLVAALRPGEQLTRSSERLPTGLDEQRLREIEAQQFANSFTTAVAVAAAYTGHDVELTTEAVVAQVVPGTPADGALRPGDVITALDGTPVTSGGELVDLLTAIVEPRAVTLTVDRDDDASTTDVEVTLAVLEATGRPGLGIVVETVAGPVELPFDVQLARANVVGPSAGLMIALAATDLLLEEDLAAGRRVVGTGEIDGTGVVGRVGAVALKIETALAAEADLVLVPLSQLEEAVAAADGRVEVVGVATLEDAVEALRGSGVAAP